MGRCSHGGGLISNGDHSGPGHPYRSGFGVVMHECENNLITFYSNAGNDYYKVIIGTNYSLLESGRECSSSVRASD
jgi:hypothetical protein